MHVDLEQLMLSLFRDAHVPNGYHLLYLFQVSRRPLGLLRFAKWKSRAVETMRGDFRKAEQQCAAENGRFRGASKDNCEMIPHLEKRSRTLRQPLRFAVRSITRKRVA